MVITNVMDRFFGRFLPYLVLLDPRRSLQARMGLAFGGLTILLIVLFLGILELAALVNRAMFANVADLALTRLQQAVLIYGLFLTGYFIVLGWVAVGRITQPITEIAAVARRIYQGERGLAIPTIAGEDEVAILSRSLNQLVSEMEGQRVALEAAKVELEARVAERTRKLSILYEMVQRAGNEDDLAAVIQDSLARVLAGTAERVGLVYLLDKHGQRLQRVAQEGAVSGVPVEVAADHPLLRRLADSTKPLLIMDMAVDGETAGLFEVAGFPVCLAVPIHTTNRTWGVLAVLGQGVEVFGEEEQDLLASVANQLGIAVERFHLRQRAEQLVVMEERNRLARELHDSVTQSLYSAVLFVEASRRMIEGGKPDKAALYLTDVSETSQQALKEMRLLVHKLRPSALAKEGLLFALEQRLKAVEGRVGIQYQLTAEEGLRLTPDVEESLYHIAQEALNNALKHARASKVAVRLQQQAGEVTLWVMDNGKGFDVAAGKATGGLGLTTMREWAAMFEGTVMVQSAPAEGTMVVARLKLPSIGEQR